MDKKLLVVISRSRTGSNFLAGLLNSHPSINFKGEVFKGFGEGDPENHVMSTFDNVSSDNEWIGFKIFYYHASGVGGYKQVLSDLEENFDVKYLHLKRSNIARSVVSREVASKTKVWHQKDSRSELKTESKKVWIDPQSLDEEICDTINNWREAEAFLEGREYLDLSYEALENDPQSIMASIFDFIDVSRKNVSSWTKKQNPESLSELVENYNQIEPVLRKYKLA